MAIGVFFVCLFVSGQFCDEEKKIGGQAFSTYSVKEEDQGELGQLTFFISDIPWRSASPQNIFDQSIHISCRRSKITDLSLE